MKKDIDDVNMAITKVEQEKTNRDHTIRSLNDEIASQDEIINKLNKEKKHISENCAKSTEDLQGASDKVDHLMKVKSKLEATLDELESSVMVTRLLCVLSIFHQSQQVHLAVLFLLLLSLGSKCCDAVI